MSDLEEPMAKIRRSEPDDQSYDDVQEEWLNEDVLTDDDFNALDNDSTGQNESLNMELGLGQDDATLTALHMEKKDLSGNIDTIDEYLDQFMDDDKEAQLDSWPAVKGEAKNAASGIDFNEIKNSDDSTDELLRVLGEEEQTPKPKLSLVKSTKSAVETKEVSSEDELFEFSDDKANLRRIFRPTKRLQKAAKSTTKSSLSHKATTMPAKVYSAPKKSSVTTRKRDVGKTLARKPATRRTATALKKAKEAEVVKLKGNLEPVVQKFETYKNVVINDEKSLKMLLENIGDEEESWEDENIEYLENEFDEETSDDDAIENLKRNDDVMPIGDDSEESDYSFYDGVATSDSDEIEECFELDIRAERAADYVPMLGNAAYILLAEEKSRVSIKLTELRKVLSQLNENVRQQTAEIEAARKKLRELNLQLNHT